MVFVIPRFIRESYGEISIEDNLENFGIQKKNGTNEIANIQ